MASYFDPATMFNSMGGPVNPNIGPTPMQYALPAMAQPYINQNADQSLQAGALANSDAAENLRMKLQSTNPMMEAKNSLEANQATAQNDPNLIASQVAATLAKAQESATGSQSKIIAEKAAFAQDLGNEINERAKKMGVDPDSGIPYNAMNSVDQKWWQDQREKAGKLGITLPAAPDQRTFQEIQAKAASVVNSPAMQAKIAEIRAQGEEQQKTATISAAAKEKVAETQVGGKMAVAGITTASQQAIWGKRLEFIQTAEQQITRDLKNGVEPNPGIVYQAGNQAYNVAAKETPLGMASLQAYGRGPQLNEQGVSGTDEGNALRQEWIKQWAGGVRSGLGTAGVIQQMKATTPDTSVTPQQAEAAKKDANLQKVINGKDPVTSGATTTQPAATSTTKVVPKGSLSTRVGTAGEVVETDAGTYVWDNVAHGWKAKR